VTNPWGTFTKTPIFSNAIIIPFFLSPLRSKNYRLHPTYYLFNANTKTHTLGKGPTSRGNKDQKVAFLLFLLFSQKKVQLIFDH